MLELNKIFFTYDEKFSISNVSLRIKSGEILGLIGESGSGKSTLLQIMANKLEPDRGEVILNGENLPKASKLLIKGHSKIKIVTQSNTLFPNISVFENIAYDLRFFNQNYIEKRTNYLLKLFKISKLKNKLPRELSGGEIQRVMIAKAIADEPKVLLLDEPFSNLDVIIKKKVLIELKSVVLTEKIACVLVTHEISDAFGMVDQLAIMQKGKLIQKGTSEEIYKFPKSKYIGWLTGDGFWFKDTKTFYRPESFVLNLTGEFTAEVNFCHFKGHYYEIYFNHQNSEIFIRQNKPIAAGTQINYDLIGINPP